MSEKKKQHYIPQLQLKKFACDEKLEKIWILDKTQKSIRLCSIADVCEENFFYKLPFSKIIKEGKLNTENLKKLDEACYKRICDLSGEEFKALDFSVENYYSDFIEPRLSHFIDKVIKSTYNGNKWVINNCQFINNDDKHEFSWILAKEFIRTKHNRDKITNITEQAYKKIIPIAAQFYGLDIKEEEINVEYAKDQIKLHHAQSIFDDEMCEMFASVIYSDIWILLENFTTEPFCCIDNTLMLNPTYKLPPFYGYGLGTYGMTIFVPLSPKYMLVMMDLNKFKDEYLNQDKRIVAIENMQKVENINYDLIHSSYKYVIFSSEFYASKYKKLCDDSPVLYEEPSKGCVG